MISYRCPICGKPFTAVEGFDVLCCPHCNHLFDAVKARVVYVAGEPARPTTIPPAPPERVTMPDLRVPSDRFDAWQRLLKAFDDSGERRGALVEMAELIAKLSEQDSARLIELARRLAE